MAMAWRRVVLELVVEQCKTHPICTETSPICMAPFRTRGDCVSATLESSCPNRCEPSANFKFAISGVRSVSGIHIGSDFDVLSGIYLRSCCQGVGVPPPGL